MLTGGQAVVQALLHHDVDTLFGVPGIQNDWLYNALYDAGGAIRVIHTRHEQGAAYMALGFAQATDRVGVFSVVPGPGFLNASAALATAQGLNARVLCLVGEIPLPLQGRGTGALHEIPDQFAILKQLTKWAGKVTAPQAAPQLVAEAFHHILSGRPGPAGLEISLDVLQATAALGQMPGPYPPRYPEVDESLIEAAAYHLGRAERPLIYVGSGAQGASGLVRQLAEQLEAPVVGYRTGQGIMDGRHHLSVHQPPSHKLWAETDAVLLIGTHARVPLQGWGRDERMVIIKIDVDPNAHTVVGKPELAITARAEDALPLLLQKLPERQRPSRATEMAALKEGWADDTAYLAFQTNYLRAIRDALGEDGLFVDELTQIGYASRILMPVYQPRSFITTGYMGTLGYGFPTALGVKVARPNNNVVAVAGDGGFLFASQELSTAVQQRIGLVTLVFNNQAYGNVQQMQKNRYGGRVIATDLQNPDIVAMACSFGARATRVETPEGLVAAMTEAFTHDLPTVIEVPHGDVPTIDRFRALGQVRG